MCPMRIGLAAIGDTRLTGQKDDYIHCKKGPLPVHADGREQISIAGRPIQNLLLREYLDWGPLHIDPHLLMELRTAFFRSPFRDRILLEEILRATREHTVILWGERTLASVVGISWVVAALNQAGNSVCTSNVFVTAESWEFLTPVNADDVRRCYESRQPLPELQEEMLGLWRWLAGETEIRDRATSKGALSEWISLADYYRDWMPNELGLDILDRTILDLVGDEWMTRESIFAEVAQRLPCVHFIPERRVWERLIELSDLASLGLGSYNLVNDPLLEALPKSGSWVFRRRSVRRSGKSVPRAYFRWLGGRLLARE